MKRNILDITSKAEAFNKLIIPPPHLAESGNEEEEKMIRRVVCAVICVLALSGFMCSKDKIKKGTDVKSLRIEARLNGPAYQGSFYKGYLPPTDCAIWIEDAAHQYVKTVKITAEVVTVGQYSHLNHLPAWTASSGVTFERLQQETGGLEGVSPAYDALTQASPLATADSVKTVSGTWDLTDKTGEKVQPGVYYVLAEAANITKGDDAVVTIQAEHTSSRIDLTAGISETPSLTAHIIGMQIQFNLTDEVLSKRTTIMGPE